MILVTLGTQRFQMNRLIEAMDAIAPGLEEEVFIQTGNSTYQPKNCRYKDFVDAEELQKMIEECSVLVTHAGVGTIMRGINAGKPIVVVPRQAEFHEHVDDHQIQIAEAFAQKNCVLQCKNVEELQETIHRARSFHFMPYKDPDSKIEDLILQYIDDQKNRTRIRRNNVDKSQKAKVQLYGNDSQIMNDAIDRVVVEIHNKKKTGMEAEKILLTGCAPQCGSTSICIGMGISLAAAKWKTLIVDCDLHKSQKFKKLNEETGNGLSDFLNEEKENQQFEDIIYRTNFENLFYIPSGQNSTSPVRLFCSDMMKQLLDYVNGNYDYVLFDFPSVAVAPDAQILFGEVDGIILISALKNVTKRQILDAKHKIAPFSEHYYGMIINKLDEQMYRKYVRRYDYYFTDIRGNQKQAGEAAARYWRKNKYTREEK